VRDRNAGWLWRVALLLVGLYFAPTLIMERRNLIHDLEVLPVGYLNLLVGWTGIGWVVLMAISLCPKRILAGAGAWHRRHFPRPLEEPVDPMKNVVRVLHKGKWVHPRELHKERSS